MAFDDLSGEQDVVSTSLTVDVPDQSAQNLADLNAAAAELRSNIEAIARSTQAFGDYLRTARDIGQTLRIPQMGGEVSGGVYEGVGGRVDSSSVPDATGALSSAADRADQMMANAEGAGVGMAAQGLVGALSSRGIGGGGEGPLGAMGGLTNVLFGGQMIHAAGAGTYRTIKDRGGKWMQNYYSRRNVAVGGVEAGGMALRMAGRVATPIAIAGLAYQGAQFYFSQRSRGLQFGEGFGAGLEKSIGERIMSLHPAISGEEASEIYNTAIAQGYAGRGDDIFGKTTEFAKNNLIDLNMSVEESFQLLQTNMDRAGQSIDSLNNSLAVLPEIAAGSAKSLETVVQQFEQINEYGVSQGMTGAAATTTGRNVAALWSTNVPLAGKTATIMQAAMSAQAFQSQLAGKYGVDVPELAISMVGIQGNRLGVDLVGQESYNWLLDTARRYSPRTMPDASEEQRFYGWWQEIISLAPQLANFDVMDLMNLFKQLQNDLRRGKSSFQEAEKEVSSKGDFETAGINGMDQFAYAESLGARGLQKPNAFNPSYRYSPSLETLRKKGEVTFVDSNGNRVKYNNQLDFMRDEMLDEKLQRGRKGGGYDIEFGGKMYTYDAIFKSKGEVPGSETGFWSSGSLNQLTINGTLTLPDGRVAQMSGTGQMTPNQNNKPVDLPR